jgi:simple sugar transport system permease protein
VAVTSDTSGAGPSQPGAQQTQEARREAGLTPLRRLATLREGPIIIVTVIALIYFGVSSSHFFNGGNFKTALLPAFAPYALMAVGEVFVMINGEIDLSVGGTYLFAPFVFYKFSQAGLPLIPALILAMIVIGVIGMINGFFVAVVGISSFVTTLGSLFALEGLTLVISKATPITPPGTTILGTSTFEKIFGGGTYSELAWALVIGILLQIALSFSRWGIYTVAVGGNRLGASEAGISARRNMIRNFAVCALCAGMVGILEAVRTTTATPDPSGANDFLFQAISAAVIGGTLLTGGSGTVIGALIGALFLGVLHDGLIILGVNANYEYLYLGIAIIVAMTINTYVSRLRTGSGRG